MSTHFETIRNDLHVYMSRTGFSLREIALRTGYAHSTLRQFSSGGRMQRGDWAGGEMADRLAAFMSANKPQALEVPGHLYETEATRQMDRLIAHAKSGGWGTIYGPAGAQKTYLLEFRAAEAARTAENNIALVGADPGLTPRALLARISQAIGAPYAQHIEQIRQSIFFMLRQRKAPLAVIIDEAQLLYSSIDTLEALRRLGDAARGKIGILVAGNEQVLELFEPRRKVYFEQWRSRIEQRKARVLGPSRDEAARIAAAEIPQASTATRTRIVDGCVATDPFSKREYVNIRRLFNTLRDFAAMAKTN